MKKAVVALSIAAALTGLNANAGTVYKKDNGDYLKVYGGAEIGGTLVFDDKKKSDFQGSGKTYVDDSFATIGIKGQTGKFFGKFELDAERRDWTPENNFQLVIDKVYGGYTIAPKHTIEYGRTDTAYDHYDAFGDPTADLAVGVSEAGDQDNTLKYRGQFGSVKMGVSYSQRGNDAETGVYQKEDDNGNLIDGEFETRKGSYKTDSRVGQVWNGYVGYFGETFTVIGGAESVDDRGEIYSVHGEAKISAFTLGGFYSIEDREKANSDSGKLLVSGTYQFTDKLAAYAAFNMLDHDKDSKDQEWGVVGAEYKYAKNVKLQGEFAAGDDSTGPLAYLIAYYWF